MAHINIKDILKSKGALLEGHFLLSSGLHSAGYVQCALVLQYPGIADELGKALASFFTKEKPDVVIAPALGGVIIGQSVAKALGVRAVFTERKDGRMLLRRGFSISPDEKVLVVEDVITTGKSTQEVITVIEKTGAPICGVGCIIDRSAETISFPGTFNCLLKLDIKSFSAEACPLCTQGIPAVKPGSRK